MLMVSKNRKAGVSSFFSVTFVLLLSTNILQTFLSKKEVLCTVFPGTYCSLAQSSQYVIFSCYKKAKYIKHDL